MDLDRLTEIARRTMAHRRTHAAREVGYTFHHGLRTARLAVQLARQASVDLDVPQDVLYAGGLLHDIGKGEEPHHEIGRRLVFDVLDGIVTPQERDAVARLVGEHNDRRQPSPCPVSSQVLQDADLLDHVGAQEIWLLFSFSATHGRSVEETIRYHRENRDDHAALRDLLNLEVSRQAFDRRIRVERDLMGHLAEESAGRP